MADVGCAGVLVADTFCGPMAQLPPAGELTVVDPFLTLVGGCAANVAISLAKQGVSVDILGAVGDDAAAQVILGGLAESGIGVDQIRRSTTAPTSQTTILLVTGEDRRYIHNFGANSEFSAADIDHAWLKTLKLFYLGGLFAMPGIVVDELIPALTYCRENGVATLVDVVVPGDMRGLNGLEKILPLIDVFTPNDDEAAQLTGQRDPVEQVKALRDHGASTVIVTRGANGAVATDGASLWTAGVHPAATVDPSGSGDAYTSGVIAGIVHGWDLDRTLSYAAALGSSATRAIGCTGGVFTASEAAEFVAANALDLSRVDISR